MKTAVLVSGQLRSLDVCLPTIRKHVLDRIGDHDIFAHIADDEDAGKISLLKTRRVVATSPGELDEKNYLHRSGRGVGAVQNVLLMFWRMAEANKLKQQAEAARGACYDWVIRLRADTQFFNDIEDLTNCDPTAVHVPRFSSYWGYQDRFAFGGSAAMDVYHHVYSQIDVHIAAGGIFHAETMLKATLDRAGTPVQRTGILFDTLRKNGERLRPVWSAAHGDVLPDWHRALACA